MHTRKVTLPTLFKLIADKKPYSTIGIIFTALAIVFLIIAFTTALGDDDGYDYETILQKGVEMQAEIIDVESQESVKINGESPVIITYTYTDNGKAVTDEFKTLDLYKAGLLIEEGNLKIRVYNGQSAITGLEPFDFPYLIFLAIPIPFLIIGLIFLFIAVKPALRTYKLYKNGIVKEAEVYAITSIAGLPISNAGRKVSVDYVYAGRSGNKLYGNTVSTDFTLLFKVKAGDAVKIFVSETDETQSTLVPEDIARKNNWKV